jgi:hypothetical protein
MTDLPSSSNSFSNYFKILESPYDKTKPCIPDKEVIIEIPQNLPQGTLYDIGLPIEKTNLTIGEQLEIVSQKLNNLIEINSLLLLKQIPDLLYNIKEQSPNKENKQIYKPQSIRPPFSWH